MNEPECKLGYPETQLREKMHPVIFGDFMRWMRGQTFSSCDGREYNHDKKEYVPTGCGPHGYVFYVTDVKRFLAGERVVD